LWEIFFFKLKIKFVITRCVFWISNHQLTTINRIVWIKMNFISFFLSLLERSFMMECETR
jgi:hypothetical protein